MMPASPLWGSLADRYGRKLMVERSMFGGALLLVVMAFVRSAEQLVLLRMLQGMITGTFGAANALVAGVVPGERMGYAMGLLQVAAGAGLAVGPLIGGAVYGLDSSVGSGARAVAPMLGVTIAALTGVRSVFAATGIVYFCAAAIALWILKPTRG